MTTREWMTENIEKYETNIDAAKACSKAIKCSLRTAQNMASELRNRSGYTPNAKASKQSQPSAKGGISLRGVNVSSNRPTDTVRPKLYQLPKGHGFPIDELSRNWGVSVDTLKKHARPLNCVQYVEVDPGQWVQCVIHPETAKELSS